MSSSDSSSSSYSELEPLSDSVAAGIAILGLLLFVMLEIMDWRGERR